MCAEISRFANSSTDRLVHKVDLINDWGGLISEEESQKKGDYTMYVKQCASMTTTIPEKVCAPI